VEVLSVSVYGGRVQELITSDGVVSAPVVVLAAGAWANRLAAPLDCGLAMAPVRSQYWLTEVDPIFPREHPVVILPDARAYTRPELGGLLFGLREGVSVGLDPGELPDDMSGYAFADDPDGWRSLEEGAPALRTFFPALDRVRIRRHVLGASTYTPDGLPLIGQVGGIEGLLAASGCCGAGIAMSGGLGQVLAALAFDDAPSFDIAPFRPDRFGNVEPSEPAFRARCAAARARKRGG
jgi:4-methylaminobutanoate oxidase (formaldehyde-forming)